MSNPDPGAFFSGMTTQLVAALNTVRTGVLNALDIAGGSRTMTAKLTLLGTDVFELGDKMLYASGQQTREHPLLLLGNYDTARWEPFYGSAGPSLRSTTTSAGTFYCNLLLPHGNQLDTVAVWFQAALAVRGGEVGTKPAMGVFRVNQSTGVRTQIGSTTTDTWVSEAAYETRRLISVTGLAHTIDNDTNTYHFGFSCEGGANAVAGAIVDSARVTCTITKQSKWL